MMREHHGMMEKEHHGPSGKSGSGKAEPGKGKKFLRGNIGRN
jgi:hypothetical protein